MTESRKRLNEISRRMLRFIAETVFVATKRILKKLDSALVDGNENKLPDTYKHIDMPKNFEMLIPHFKINPEISPHKVVSWDSEMQFMAGLADKWDNTETGSELYGLITPNNELVVMYVTPPGPDAIHEYAHFRPDISFLKDVNEFLRDNFCLCYCGNYHNHHSLGLTSPSVSAQ